MAALPPPSPGSVPAPAGAARPAPQRKLTARNRYVLAMEAADTTRAELAAATLEGAPVAHLAELLARLARQEAAVSVADRRNSLVVRLATAAGRYVR